MKKITLELVKKGFDSKTRATAIVKTDETISAALDRAVKKLGGTSFVWNSGVKGMLTVVRGTIVKGDYYATIDDELMSPGLPGSVNNR